MKFKKLIVSTWFDIGHVPTAFRNAGFSYLYAIPRPVCDSWEFYCCEGESLPEWARSVEFDDANEMVGIGFNEEMAHKCNEWMRVNFPSQKVTP